MNNRFSSRRVSAGVGQTCKRVLDCEHPLKCCRDLGICAHHCTLKSEGERCSETEFCKFGHNCCNGRCWKDRKCEWTIGQPCELTMPWTNTNECELGSVCINNLCQLPGSIVTREEQESITSRYQSKFSSSDGKNDGSSKYQSSTSKSQYSNMSGSKR